MIFREGGMDPLYHLWIRACVHSSPNKGTGHAHLIMIRKPCQLKLVNERNCLIS